MPGRGPAKRRSAKRRSVRQRKQSRNDERRRQGGSPNFVPKKPGNDRPEKQKDYAKKRKQRMRRTS
jgi:hypothetical protein